MPLFYQGNCANAQSTEVGEAEWPARMAEAPRESPRRNLSGHRDSLKDLHFGWGDSVMLIVPGPGTFIRLEVLKTGLLRGKKHVFEFPVYRG